MKRVKKENVPQKRGSSVCIPRNVIAEILLKLPSKSVPKLIVVSKLWSSIIRSKDFIDLYMKRSLTRPCFLISFEIESTRFFYSTSQEAAAQSSCATTTTRSRFLLRLDPRLLSEGHYINPPVRGLICCQDLDRVVVSNPSTGQFFVLPKVRTRRKYISRFFGYDPIRDEYKVLCMTVLQVSCMSEPVVSDEHQVFTLGEGARKKKEARWRMIKCKIDHCPATRGLWMPNGVIYYGAWSKSDHLGSLVVCFDVRLEKFSLVKLPDGAEALSSESALVSYQGKVALLNHSYAGNFDMWVLEDVDRQNWSNISVVVPSWNDLSRRNFLYCRGVISSGEFIFSAIYYPDGRFFFVSYDPKEDIATRVEIEGSTDRLHYVLVLLDYAECPIIL